MKKYAIFSALVMMLLSIMAETPSSSARRQRTTRLNLKTSDRNTMAQLQYDTLNVDSAEVKFSGYEKPLRSHRETMFVANNSKDTIKAMTLSIGYYDTSGNMLHQREVNITTNIIPGQRRMIDFPSWDKQQVFYYIKSVPSSRTRGSATPYTITVTPILILAGRNK